MLLRWFLSGSSGILSQRRALVLFSDHFRHASCLYVRESLSEVHQKTPRIWNLDYVWTINKHTDPDSGFQGWGNGLWRTCGMEGSLSVSRAVQAAPHPPNQRLTRNLQLHFQFCFSTSKWCLLWRGMWAISLSPQWLEEQNILYAFHCKTHWLKTPHGQLACSVLLSRCPV